MTDKPSIKEKPYKIIFEGKNCIGSGKCAEVSKNWGIDISDGIAKPNQYFLDEKQLKQNKEAANICPAKNGKGVIKIIDRKTKDVIYP